ncbi:hypothetical protein AURDEDRAFT_110322 [Auricularia subglabra TFB-10046 SS5]|nr:hypothetical protein AURDEDRAFT_110322 [Auricularia subglabra TFB-10046 SS5]
MRRLIECMVTDTCAMNQTKVVLFTSWDFTFALEGSVSGENIWANSVIYSLYKHGYTFLFAEDHRQLAEQYRIFPSLVKVIIAHAEVVHDCFRAEECIKSPRNPNGVPLWKMFTFEFWRDSYKPHPLGNAWTLAPTEYGNGHVFIGYSVNHTCSLQPFLPHSQRKHQAFVLAKRLSYFYKDTYAWPGVDYAHPPSTLHDLAFVGAMWNDTKDESVTQPSPQVPAGINNLDGSTLATDDFFAALSQSKVLVGVGQPFLSPSPYDALCLGVPFINPVYQWDRQNPHNRSAWAAQHDGLRLVEEPYVYHVLRVPDLAERTRLFWEAVSRAVNTPINRNIPEDMTPEAVMARVSRFVEADWRSRAEQLKKENPSGKKLPNFTL